MENRGRSSPAGRGLSRTSSFSFDYTKGWKNCWGGFRCFAPLKRVKYERADTYLAPQSIPVEASATNGSLTLDTLNPVVILPPVMCAPPPSPESIAATFESASSQLSRANLLTLFPEKGDNFGNHQDLHLNPTNADTHIESFLFNSALITPPIHSTLTTAPATPFSTAPFTPPPELAHLTTPPSPEVPFAELLETSFAEFRSSLSEKVERLSLQSFPSAHLHLTHRLYPCNSPLGQLVRFNSQASTPETLSPMPERVPFDGGTSSANGIKNCFLSALESASLEGFGLGTSESVCEMPFAQRQGQQKSTGCLQESLLVSTKLKDASEENDRGSSHFAHDSCSYDCRHKDPDSESCCSRCGELSAKCKDLSEALEQTRRKLTLVETRVNSIDERERRFKQLIQWMQLSAKLRQESIFQLSEELSWQGAAFLDLQDCHLAEAGISIPNSVEKDDT